MDKAYLCQHCATLRAKPTAVSLVGKLYYTAIPSTSGQTVLHPVLVGKLLHITPSTSGQTPLYPVLLGKLYYTAVLVGKLHYTRY